MIRIVAVALFVFGATTVMAQRPLSVGISVGAAVPVGDLADDVRAGYEGGVLLSAAASSRLLVRGEATYRAFRATNGAPDLRVIGLSGNLIVELRKRGSMRPYAIGGVGVYRSRFAPPAAQTENDIAANAGVGLALERGSLRIFSEMRFHNIFSGSNDSDASRRFVPVTLGFTVPLRQPNTRDAPRSDE